MVATRTRNHPCPPFCATWAGWPNNPPAVAVTSVMEMVIEILLLLPGQAPHRNCGGPAGGSRSGAPDCGLRGPRWCAAAVFRSSDAERLADLLLAVGRHKRVDRHSECASAGTAHMPDVPPTVFVCLRANRAAEKIAGTIADPAAFLADSRPSTIAIS